jgi:hypothetical protein
MTGDACSVSKVFPYGRSGLASFNYHEKAGWAMAMNSPRLLGRHQLINGLILELWDHSRPLVGDRWFVRLEARVAIPVRAETLPPELNAQFALVVEALGEEIIFSQEEARNFIAAADAPGLLQEMQDRVLALARGYFGHADFAARFIRKRCAEQQKLEQWQRLDTRGEDV